MKCITRLFVFFVLALGLSATTGQAQTQTGTVTGTVLDQQGAVLPGATVTLTGARGSLNSVTDGHGEFRFVGVAPGVYVLKAELSGFLPQQRDEVTVGMGKTVTTEFTLKVGGLSETVEVSGSASTVDVKSSATDTTISNDLLQLTPIYSSTSTGLLNYAPGINSSSAFGGQGSYGNALLLDGVDTRDPEGGSAWTFFNQNLIEEIQIGGLGAPAEYGGFTGAIINTVTKSGGNAFSGLFSMRYTNDSLAGDNIDQKLLDQNPDLGNAAITKKLTDYTVQMGGPLKRDKAFFFASIQRYSALTDPVGLVANAQDISPRFNVKMTLQPTTKDTIVLGTQYDSYNVTGRVGYWPSAQATDQQTVNEDAPEWVWNAQWRRIFGTNTLLETKFTGYTGYYNLDPVDPSPFTYDGESGTYSGGGGGLYYADRNRNVGQVSLTKYAEKFGTHSFKFGAEIERSHVRSQYQPYGPQGFYIYAYGGVPYARYSYGYDVQGDNHRTSAYAQDQWSAGRLTLNIGLRLDHIRGYSPVLKETVYKPKAAWGPRVGAAYDLGASGNAVLKGFWGRYYEGAATGFYTSATPGIEDFVARVRQCRRNPRIPRSPDARRGLPDRQRHQTPEDRRGQRSVRDPVDASRSADGDRHLAQHRQFHQQRDCRRGVRPRHPHECADRPVLHRLLLGEPVGVERELHDPQHRRLPVHRDRRVRHRDGQAGAQIQGPDAGPEQLDAQPLRLPGLVRPVEGGRQRRQQRIRELPGRHSLGLAEHGHHQRLRRADELATA